jgi:two-component system NarL family response regulator
MAEIIEGTVKTHVSNILIKLGASDRTQAATEALRRGILHMD